jgi:hypothetical protein
MFSWIIPCVFFFSQRSAFAQLRFQMAVLYDILVEVFTPNPVVEDSGTLGLAAIAVAMVPWYPENGENGKSPKK